MWLGRLPQTDGGYLGLDIAAFVSAVVSGAPGVFATMLLHDAGIETDLVVQPGQRVSVSGDPSLPRPPTWGGGSFTVQQRGSLSLSSVEVLLPGLTMSGGELSLSRMDVPEYVLTTLLYTPAAGTILRLSEVTVPDSWQGPVTLAGSATVGADGAPACDPPDLCSVRATRSPLPSTVVETLS